MKNKLLQQLLETDTDIALFVNLYKRFNIKLLIQAETIDGDFTYIIELVGPDFRGYGGSSSEVLFDVQGKFIQQWV